eukprot:XP_011678586.1 PREDICTED: uncharacterized protein LOC105445136 [Strongylocentrotus purpuratus]
MFPRCVECVPNVSDCPETASNVAMNVTFTSPNPTSGRRKRAAVPIGSTVVQNLLDSIVNAVDSLPEVISVNGIAISANDDVVDLITSRVGLDIAFRNDITIQQLTSLVIASINNIPGVDVQSFELLTDPCSLDNPCGNGATCERVEPGSANVICTPQSVDGSPTALIIALPIVAVLVILFLVAMGFLARIYRRRRWQMESMYGVSHGMTGNCKKVTSRNRRSRPSRYRQTKHFVHGGTSGPRRKRSRSVGHLSSGHINPPFVHEYKDGLEMGWSLNTGEAFRHDSEAQGLSSRQTVDDSGFAYRYPTTSGYRAEVSYSNGAPKRNGQDKFYHGSLDTYF